jgi:hypothetical protein
MNKLVIIGNGFDLAHGLPTSYSHLMNFFWKSLPQNYEKPEVANIVYINPSYYRCMHSLEDKKIECFSDFQESFNRYIKLYLQINYSFDFKKATFKDHESRLNSNVLEFRNQFFHILNQFFDVHNWVDIENAYYQILTSIVREESKKYSYTGRIKKLNAEFEVIKNLLESYINNEVILKNDFCFSGKNKTILELFKNKISEEDINMDDYLSEFPHEDRNDLHFFNDQLKVNKRKDKKINDILFLDFNYTKTVDTYVDEINKCKTPIYPKAEHIPIHGKIEDKDNPINFGFGDEMDDNYKALEKADDNNYLKNIKSFQYLNNGNYRKLLNWVGNKKFLVYIMGHSCGLSDRTMLNTIFEHPNCRSIKIFYREKETKEKRSDNFIEITQNISRHFNKKALMRSKIVDKSLCQPLPQTCRFEKM